MEQRFIVFFFFIPSFSSEVFRMLCPLFHPLILKLYFYFYSILFDCFRPSVKLQLFSIPAWSYAAFHMHVAYSLLKRWILYRACGLVLIYTSLFAGFQILRVLAKRFCIPFHRSAILGATAVPFGTCKMRAKIPEWSRKYPNDFQILSWVAHILTQLKHCSWSQTYWLLLPMILGSSPDQMGKFTFGKIVYKFRTSNENSTSRFPPFYRPRRPFGRVEV